MDQKIDELDIQMRLELFLVPSTYRALQDKAKTVDLSAAEYICLMIDESLKGSKD